MLSKFKLILAGIGAFLVLLVTVFFKGRASGVAATESQVQDVKDAVKVSEQAATVAVAQKKEDNAKVKADVQNKTITSSDKAIDEQLAEKWTRD